MNHRVHVEHHSDPYNEEHTDPGRSHVQGYEHTRWTQEDTIGSMRNPFPLYGIEAPFLGLERHRCIFDHPVSEERIRWLTFLFDVDKRNPLTQ